MQNNIWIMLDINKMKTCGVVTMKILYKEKGNERKQHSKQDRRRTQFSQKHNLGIKESFHEYFSLYNNFIGVFIQQDKVKEMKRKTTKLSKQILEMRITRVKWYEHFKF